MLKDKKEINFPKIEKKWQKRWEEKKVFEVSESGKKKKYYILEMYPYPSSSGLHMGHAFNYTIGDILARYMRMKGFNVLHPMGYDSFGLPAENAAIKANTHPKKYTDDAIKNFIKQQKSLGLSYDWSRMLKSHDSEYYKWNQFLFLQFHKKGLAYRKKASVNWCGKCGTVLANEQVLDGKCWRHKDTEIEIRNLEQWFLKTTKYADELLREIDSLDWPERIKAMQKNWIGRSEGAEIDFEIDGKKWPIFTTRADTLFGVTFLVVSAQHPKLMEIVSDNQKEDVEKFVKKIKSTKQEDIDKLEKEGVFTGAYAKHPLTGERIPIWAGNFVVADYGSGMVMAVPAHDQRDFEFAKKYGINIKQVIAPLFVTDKGKDAIREDAKTVVRDSVFAIIKHWKEDKYFCLDWKKFGWKSLIIGGIDKGETAEEAVRREVKEESGYSDIRSVIPVGFENHGNYYAEHKNENRYAKFKAFLIELKSDKREQVKEEHTKNHEGKWIDKSKVKDFLSLANNNYVWDTYLNGERAYTDYGKLINSGPFSELQSDEAKEHMVNALVEKKLGRKKIQYKLRDWLISRQRYWGTPIPVIYCGSCGIVSVHEKDLPVLLPEKVKFGEGNPLEGNKKFLEVKCPKCNKIGRRETDTMILFFDSSWYFLRFADAKNKEKPFLKEKAEYWMPVDFYTGGAEHAVMHLIYARFFVKFLRDLGFLKLDEPFKRLFNQGMVHGEDGVVMSKSRGNVVDPLDISKKYGADALRVFLISMASPDKDFAWSSIGVESSWKLASKIFSYVKDVKIKKSSKKMEHKINLAIKKITENIESLKYNFAVINIRELLDILEDEISKTDLENIVKLVSPFMPHLTEELWEKIGNKGFVSLAEWPKYDEKKIDMKLEEQEKNLSKTVSDVLNVLKIVKEKQGKEGEKIYLYTIPGEYEGYDSGILSKKIGKEVKVYRVNDAEKYDPEGKAGKAKPGKPGIYVE